MMFLTISEAAANAECSQILSKSFFKSSSTPLPFVLKCQNEKHQRILEKR